MALMSVAGRPNAGLMTQGNPAGGAAPSGTHGSMPAGRRRFRGEDRGDGVKRDQRSQNFVENGGIGGNPSSTLLKGGEYQKDVKRDVPDLALGPMPSGPATNRHRSGSGERSVPPAWSDANSESASETSPPLREFRVHGIDAYPSLAIKKEICIDFIDRRKWCPYSTMCHRIHPIHRKFYLALLLEGKSQVLFHQDGPLSTANHSRGEGSGSDSSPVRERTPLPHFMEKPLPPSLNKNLPLPCPKRGYNWDPATGHWTCNLDQEAWGSEDSSSSDGSVDLFTDRHVSQTSRSSSDTEEDTQCPSLTLKPSDPRENCRDFRKGCCKRGAACRFYHAVQGNEAKVPPQSPASLPPPPSAPVIPPRFRNTAQAGSPYPPDTCNLWLKGRCWRGKACHYLHPEIKTEGQVASPSISTSNPQLAQRHQRPPLDEACRDWLRGLCQKGPRCVRVHGDLEYDETRPRRSLIQVPARTIPEMFSTVIYKHIKIQVTEGFEVVEVVTGFETSWIYIGNVPRRVQHERLATLLKNYGELIDLRVPESSGPFVVAKARFVDAATASKVCSVVDGLEAFGSTLTAKLSISVNSDARVRLNDTSVRIKWEAPSKTAYVGFNTKESYTNAMGKCRSTPLGKHLLRAAAHTGIPAVGRFSLRVDAVPADVDVEGLKEFLGANAVMWGQTNYTSSVKALNGIQKMVTESGTDVLDFNVIPPPFKGGIVVAWAHLATPAEAKKLCDYMHARKPNFTGHTRIFAHHVQSLEYTLPKDVYERVRRDIDALAASAWRMGHFTVVSKVLPLAVLVRLGAEETQGLSTLKTELDVILSGEIVREDGKVVWDRFFPHLAGQTFIAALQREHAPITIQVDRVRKHIRLFGASAGRLAVRMKIMEKVEALRKQSVHTIPLDARMLGVFMNEGLARFSEVGDDCVQLDLWNRSLVVRGDQHTYNAVRDSVNRTRRSFVSTRNPAVVECPVCFDEVSTPITLCCGHSWCKTCIIRYMMTAVDQKVFPLTCLGDDAKCLEKIPLSCGKQLLPPPDFEALIEASFSTYIHRRLDEFSYCPTPDCQQIYRRLPLVNPPQQPPKLQKSNSSPPSQTPSVSVGTVLQCPSCLVRICASCQTEAHDGLACVRPGDADSLFEEWMKNNGVKPCPGCKMPIEKIMGCHHVTCTVCSIHVCWLCLTPFHNGAGVYSHMLAVHGSFV